MSQDRVGAKKVHARYLLIKTKTSGRDSMSDAVLSGDEQAVTKYQLAKEIYDNPVKKSYVEACLLASQDFDAVAKVLGLKPYTVKAYHDFFYNVSDLDKLSKLSLIEESASNDERVMKLWSYTQGLEFVAWRLGEAVPVDPIGGLKELFTLCVYKSKEALFAGGHTEAGKEATKWTKLSMDLARLLKLWVMDSDAARKDIEMALKTINPEFEGFDSLDNEDDSDTEE